jgi:AraC-like DNA-binding protein
MKQEFFAAPPSAVSPPIHERHYTVQEIAEAWNMSENLVRRLFEKEPGVVIFKKGQAARTDLQDNQDSGECFIARSPAKQRP